MSRRRSLLSSLLLLSPIILCASYLGYRQHSKLPLPTSLPNDPTTGLPQLSEALILGHSKHLSEGIGYRTVGTREHALADAWLLDQAEALKKQCEDIASASGRKLECEVWRQQGSGSHRFDMMGKRVYKTYVNLTNIIVRISDGTPESKEHAVLVNSHLDSTLPSPGAADDALPVGVMLDCIRVLVNTPDWTPSHAIVFLFNNAEESLQDGSHLYSTQHETAPTVRAIINLEAAGTTGRELLFQATSEEMIQAYAKVPRPFGTIFANDIFSSGVLLSDTDFRQFEQYLNVTGLDMAVVGNSYLYHMRKDLVENIEPGVAQHMAENTLALLQYLSSEDSPLPRLTSGYTKPTTVFFSYFGIFLVYSFSTAKALHGTLFISSAIFTYWSMSRYAPSHGSSVTRELKKGCIAILASFAGSLISSNLVAFVMQQVLGKGMSWFSYEYSTLLLYIPPTLLGALLPLYLLGPISEHTVYLSIIVIQASVAFLVQMLNVGSAAIFFLSALPLFVSLVLSEIGFTHKNGELSLAAYAVGVASPLFAGTLLMVGVVDVFVPLTGRLGEDVPADNVIATIVSTISALAFPLVPAFTQRFHGRVLRRCITWIGMLTVVMMAVFCTRNPYDDMHQKRIYILHLENVTSQERSLHIAASDGGPGFHQLVQDIASEFGTPKGSAEPVVMDDYNTNWDTLYPFSAFLSPFKIPLDPSEVVDDFSRWNDLFKVVVTNDVFDHSNGTRSLTLVVHHPGLIWTVIAFDAHVLQWTLDDNPPDEYARHHIKEGSFYGTETWSIDLVVKVNPHLSAKPDAGSNAPTAIRDASLTRDGSNSIDVSYIGIRETAMWPGKRAEKAAGGPAMVLFEKLDGWILEKTRDTVNPMLLGCVAGSVSL